MWGRCIADDFKSSAVPCSHLLLLAHCRILRYFVALGFVLEYQQELLPDRNAVRLHECGAGLPSVCCWEAGGPGWAPALCYHRNKPFAVWTTIKVPAQVHVSSAACWVALWSLSWGTRVMNLRYLEKLHLLSLPAPYQCLSQCLKISPPIFCPFFLCVFKDLCPQLNAK